MDVTETWPCPAPHSSQGLLLTNHTEERQGGRERKRDGDRDRDRDKDRGRDRDRGKERAYRS